MYCNKCGKEIEKGTLCNECLVAELVGTETTKTEPQTPAVQEPVVYTRQTIASESNVDASGNFSFFNEATNAPTPEQTSFMPEPNNRMYGFGKALASAIISELSFVVPYIGVIVAAFQPAVGIMLWLLSLPMVIISFIFGIQSIKVFMARRSSCVKPIPTLVVGIVGLATAAFAMFFAFVELIVLIAFAAAA